MPKPRPDPTQNSKLRYMIECVDDLLESGEAESEEDAQQQCEILWQEANPTPQRSARAIINKTSPGKAEGLRFVMSDETLDRHGDVILASSWQLDNFKRTGGICLFNHNADWPIGNWTDVRVENGALKGTLKLAPPGTSTKSDEVARLISAGILKSCSVGFFGLEHRPREGGRGVTFTRAELTECSVVSIPSNPAAALAAKSLGISDETQRLVFTKQSDSAQRARTKRARELRARGLKLIGETERKIAQWKREGFWRI